MNDANYLRNQETAIRQIKKYGRLIQVQTPATIDSGTGPAFDRNRNNDRSPPTTTEVYALQTELESEMVDGVVIRKTDLSLMIAGDSEINTSQTIIDTDGRNYKIIDVMPLKPGNINILYQVVVR